MFLSSYLFPVSKLGETHKPTLNILLCPWRGAAGVRARGSSAGWEDVHHVWEERRGLSEGAAVLWPQDRPLGRAGRWPSEAGVARHGCGAGKALRHRGKQQRLWLQEGRSPGETVSHLWLFLPSYGCWHLGVMSEYANQSVCSAMAAGWALPPHLQNWQWFIYCCLTHKALKL